MPSRRSHSVCTTGTSSSRTALADARKSCTAGESGAPYGSGRSRSTFSCASPSGIRLVASTPIPAHVDWTSWTTRATSSSTCSQLSATTSSCRCARWARRSSITGRPGVGTAPTASASASVTWSGECTNDRSTNHTPSGQSAAASSPNSIARRVFPPPPGPAIVTSAPAVTVCASHARSSSRSTMSVRNGTRLCPSAGRTRSGRPGSIHPSAATTWSDTGCSKSRTRNRPRSSRRTDVGSVSADRVSSVRTICPPWAALTIRAAWFTARAE